MYNIQCFLIITYSNEKFKNRVYSCNINHHLLKFILMNHKEDSKMSKIDEIRSAMVAAMKAGDKNEKPHFPFCSPL